MRAQYLADIAGSRASDLPRAVTITRRDNIFNECAFAVGDSTYYVYTCGIDTYAYLGNNLVVRVNYSYRQPETGLPYIQEFSEPFTTPAKIRKSGPRINCETERCWKLNMTDGAWAITHRHMNGLIQLWNAKTSTYRLFDPADAIPNFIDRVCDPRVCGLGEYIEAMRGVPINEAANMYTPGPSVPIPQTWPLPIYLEATQTAKL